MEVSVAKKWQAESHPGRRSASDSMGGSLGGWTMLSAMAAGDKQHATWLADLGRMPNNARNKHGGAPVEWN
jgi:hypothetical protein